MQKGNIKKIITYTIIIISLFINQAYSQISFGIKAGLNFNSGLNQTYYIESLKTTPTRGFYNIFDEKNGHQFGIFSKINFGNFFLRPEIYFSKINSKYDLTYQWNIEGEIIDEFSENRVNIPILVGIDVFRKRISFFGGPTFNFVSDVFFDENNLKESISDLYSKSLLTLQYGASLNFNKLSFDFRIDKGFGDREIVYAEELLGENKNQIVKTDGLLTMISVSYKF